MEIIFFKGEKIVKILCGFFIVLGKWGALNRKKTKKRNMQKDNASVALKIKQPTNNSTQSTFYCALKAKSYFAGPLG